MDRWMTGRQAAAVGIGLVALGLAACTTGGGGGGDGGGYSRSTQRPVVNVPNQVTSVDRRLIVGTWQCRELNPLPGMPVHPTNTTTYNADGTFVGESRTSGGESPL